VLADMQRVTPPSTRVVLAPRWRVILAGVLARAGLQDSARRTLARARAEAHGDPEADYYEARTQLLLGERDEALRLLDRYLQYDPGARKLIAGDPAFDPLAAAPRFQALVREP
jgi:hypothetical protein